MEVSIGVSARHMHLTLQDLHLLFGSGYQLKIDRELTQLGEFAAQETVTIKTDKGEINNVRILGPIRDYTQVEISKTDSYLLGIKPPVRDSGDLIDAARITIVGPNGSIERNCCIIANRHIHANKEDLMTHNLRDGQIVKVKVNTIKGGIMDHVYIKYDDSFKWEMHIDLDDANGHLISSGDIGYVIVDAREKNE